MSIDPRLLSSSGTPGGLASTLSDLQRRLRKLEALRTYLGDGSITGPKIASDAITANHIAAGSITAAEIQAGAIEAIHIAALAIETGHLAAQAVTAEKIAAETITAAEIAARSITADRIATHTITAQEIAAGTITADEIAALAITTPKLDAGAVTAEKIASNTITANEIAAATITGANIAGGTITGDNIAGGTITGDLIASDTITGDLLVAGSITADKLDVTELSAISANLGNIEAGTITGGIFRTSATNPRVQLDPTGLTAIDGAGVVRFKADAASGKIITLAGVGGANLLTNAGYAYEGTPGEAAFGFDEFNEGTDPLAYWGVLPDPEALYGKTIKVDPDGFAGDAKGIVTVQAYKVPANTWRTVSVFIKGDGDPALFFDTPPDEIHLISDGS